MGLVEKLRTLRSTGVVSWCRKPSRRLRKAARDWAALRVRQASSPRTVSLLWWSLVTPPDAPQAGSIRLGRAEPGGFPRGLHRCVGGSGGGASRPSVADQERPAHTYLMVAVHIVRRVLQQVRGPIHQLGLIVLEMEEVVPPFCKTTWAVWAASRESWPRPEQPPPPSSSHDPPPLHPRPLCSATGSAPTGSDKPRPVRWLYPLRHPARCPRGVGHPG